MTDDDWLHPKMTSSMYISPPPKEEWLIQRERTLVCTWVGDGPPRKWALWRAFDSSEERDAELKRLRETTSWHLRPAYKPLHGHIRVEDEEVDLLRRLAEVRAKK